MKPLAAARRNSSRIIIAQNVCVQLKLKHFVTAIKVARHIEGTVAECTKNWASE